MELLLFDSLLSSSRFSKKQTPSPLQNYKSRKLFFWKFEDNEGGSDGFDKY